MPRRYSFLAVLLILAGGSALRAQVKAPPSPKEYDVQLRYRIHAGRNQRIASFYELTRHLADAGFNKDDGPENEAEDAALNRMTGTVASDKALALLQDPRVKSLLLTPAGYKLPTDDSPVRIRIDLASGYSRDTQRLLADEVAVRLFNLGFREATGYDHRGFTRLVGTFPASEVPGLFFDLRGRPAGWLVPEQPPESLPEPLRSVSPLRVVEVMPWPEGVEAAKELPAEAPIAPELLKMTPELRARLAKDGEGAKVALLEVILAAAPADDNKRWVGELVAEVPEVQVLGRAGAVVTVRCTLDKAKAFAGLPFISVVRSPASGTPLLLPAADPKAKDANKSALEATGLARLHKLGARGQGVRVAVVAGDFRGYEELVGKTLPAGTRLIDLTTGRNPTVEADPLPAPEVGPSEGLQCAVAAALAAPDAELLLVRVDPTAPYQLLEIARRINGEVGTNPALDQRLSEFEVDRTNLRFRWVEMLKERAILLDNFDPEDEAQKLRDDYFEREKKLKAEETEFHKRMDRYLQHTRDLRELQKVRIVVSPLSWQTAWPVDGGSPLSRYLDDHQFRNALWFTPAGDVRGQTWVGLFRDADSNGFMEFAPDKTPLRAGRWTPELNFLAWQPTTGERTPELPEKTTVRVTVQWREIHDPSYLRRGEDLYLKPLAEVNLQLLRQRDPTGEKLPTDDLELTARSVGQPLRIDNQPDSATYEQTMEYTVEGAGRYALRVVGHAPARITPAGVPLPPGTLKVGELRPRLFLEVIGDTAARSAGRFVFLDYPTDEGTIATPADARSVLAVGGADAKGAARPAGSPGPATNLQLLIKPNFLAPDALEVPGAEGASVYQGSPLAASFAAGLAASTLSTGLPLPGVQCTWPIRPGELLRVPAEMRPLPIPKKPAGGWGR